MHKTSRAAVAATARMVVDIARSFNENSLNIAVEILPPRCSHLVRAARHLLTNEDVPSYERLAGVEQIKIMLNYLDRRWKMAGKSICMHLRIQIQRLIILWYRKIFEPLRTGKRGSEIGGLNKASSIAYRNS